MSELKNDFTRCDVEASLCAWEHILPRHDDGGYWGTLFEELGTSHMRHHAIDMGVKIDAAYSAVSEEWAGYCYDWQFVPNLLEALKDPIKASEEDFIAIAKTLTPIV